MAKRFDASIMINIIDDLIRKLYIFKLFLTGGLESDLFDYHKSSFLLWLVFKAHRDPLAPGVVMNACPSLISYFIGAYNGVT